jgi:secreted PhoX family phosphatase
MATNQNGKLSRRSLLANAAALAGAALTATIVPSKQALAQKASKEAMKYQEKPNGDQRCSNCQQFVPPASCNVVDGAISPNGYCLAWVKKA